MVTFAIHTDGDLQIEGWLLVDGARGGEARLGQGWVGWKE